MAGQKSYTAVNPKTGERVAWVNGQWVPAGTPTGAGSPQDREMLTGAVTAANIARQTAEKARRFNELNQQTGTGGIETVFADKGPIGSIAGVAAGWAFPNTRDRIQEMDSLSSGMLRANIQPGQASTMNSNAEQEVAKSTYPAVRNTGGANTAITRDLYLNARLATLKAKAMEDWYKTNRSLAGFDSNWAQREAMLRQAARAPAAPQPAMPQAAPGAPAQNMPQRPRNVPPDAMWNGQAWVMP